MSYKTKSKKDKVWEKGKPIRGKDKNLWRRDAKGRVIHYHAHGKYNKYGWHMDHIKPKSKGGSDHMVNMQPLHWKTNLAKSDKVRKKPRKVGFFKKLERLLLSIISVKN